MPKYWTVVEVKCPCGNVFNLRSVNGKFPKEHPCHKCNQYGYKLIVQNSGTWKVKRYDKFSIESDATDTARLVGQNEVW